MITDILGYVAATFTTGCFIPQLIKILKTKQTNDISLGMFIMVIIGGACWFVYGLMIKSQPVIVANFISIIINLIITGYKIRYK